MKYLTSCILAFYISFSCAGQIDPIISTIDRDLKNIDTIKRTHLLFDAIDLLEKETEILLDGSTDNKEETKKLYNDLNKLIVEIKNFYNSGKYQLSDLETTLNSLRKGIENANDSNFQIINKTKVTQQKVRDSLSVFLKEYRIAQSVFEGRIFFLLKEYAQEKHQNGNDPNILDNLSGYIERSMIRKMSTAVFATDTMCLRLKERFDNDEELKELFPNIYNNLPISRDGTKKIVFDDINEMYVRLNKINEYNNLINIFYIKQIEKTETLRTIFLGLTCLSLALLLFVVIAKNKKLKKQHLLQKAIFRELRHRIGNNLRLVSALLEKQAKMTEQLVAKRIIHNTSDRINSIGKIHKFLYKDNQIRNIDIKPFLENLINSIKEVYSSSGAIEIQQSIENIKMDSDSATYIGMIINEIVTNSFKHGFNDIRELKLKINISLQFENQIKLFISDNGPGFDIYLFEAKAHQDTIGLWIIDFLIKKQFNGHYDYENNNGTIFTAIINLT